MKRVVAIAAVPFRESQEVGYVEEHEVEWQIRCQNHGAKEWSPWQESDKSQHELYLTWKKPLLNENIYETVLHVGCSEANEASAENQIIDKVWSRAFKELTIRRKGSEVTLQYYGNYMDTGEISTTAGLLSNDN
ncbi:MAG: hypothetical protein FWG50_11800 [Kiritimatiellaeota bacterium]|nr:hypothetical protein [Kiritimatiellota bacterium]